MAEDEETHQDDDETSDAETLGDEGAGPAEPGAPDMPDPDATGTE
jgi:hypothetical protein